MKYIALVGNVINIFGVIGRYEEVELADIAEKINQISGKIEVRINSEGGDIFTAQAIYNLLKEREVGVKIIGQCASAATLIACAGQKVNIAKNGLYIIHEPKVLIMDFKDINELMKEAENLAKVRETLITVYRERTGKTAEEIDELMKKETYMTANEAVENGFCDEVTEEKSIPKENPLNKDVRESGVKNIKSGYYAREKEQMIEQVARYANKGGKYNARI